ncbi:DNA-3-methyladenine glycosylase I [Listeria booriae]|uniref:DNA-3-methyladenine glycosylase I n=1 Tax=Listeria booriae TaxID=1552123 RepID=UPI001629CD9C|nr:DNA-3-methyladenine glycosylase I [Listeria booriae]MBC1912904.1 DNA-3-methyladenine glycosylase I [Listeria booriae]
MQQERCGWAMNDSVEQVYHDNEWGIPSHDERYLFEMLNLEGAQAGLSWRLILNKRAAYKAAFHDFDPDKCAMLTDEELEHIRETAEIVRNKLKIRGVRKNAVAFLKVQAEFGSFGSYIWGFTDGKQIVNHWTDMSQMPAQTALSERISKDLKKRGFIFVGPVIIYSYLQAIGMIDDHVITCPYHTENRS